MRRRDETGASLVIVLAFITALSLVIGSVLFASATSQRTTGVSATVTNAVYAVDSGVEFGIAHLRQGLGVCATVNHITGEIDLPDGFAGGQDVTVTCTGAESKQISQGVSSYAVVTFSPDPGSLRSQSGNGVEKQVSGRVFVNGPMDLQAKVLVNATPPPKDTLGPGDGSVTQGGTTCLPRPSNLIVKTFVPCSGLSPASIDPQPELPGIATLATRSSGPVATPTINSTQCGIFLPGRYSTLGPSSNALELLAGPGTANYLASGVYYFDNVGRVRIDDPTDLRLFGGELGGELKALPDSPCATDVQAGSATGDKGIQIILGGNSWLDIGKATVELATYRPVGGGPGRGVSLRTVPSSPPPGWTASLPGGTPNGLGLKVTTGNTPKFSVHGLAYMPNAAVEINDTNASAAQILGGVMAWTLDINASASAADLIIQVTGERPKARSEIVIEASVPLSTTKTVKSRAVVDVHVTPPPRPIADGVTHSSTLITTATTTPFTIGDVGSAIYGANIPRDAYITQFNNSSSVTISVPTTTTVPPDISPVQLTIDPSIRTVTDGLLTNNSTQATSLAFNFTADDEGAIIRSLNASGDPDGRIPASTTIETFVNDSTIQLSKPANTTGPSDAGVTLRVDRQRVTVSTNSWRVENR